MLCLGLARAAVGVTPGTLVVTVEWLGLGVRI